jgi:hypothetical protein
VIKITKREDQNKKDDQIHKEVNKKRERVIKLTNDEDEKRKEKRRLKR